MIYVGTCGFSYKDWIGSFYPATIRQNEMLDYYAGAFPAVEIDSSYYGVPQPATIRSLIRRTPHDFRFCFKVPKTVTHAANLDGIHPDAHLFAETVQPVLDAGKFGVALLQFANGFHNTPETRRYFKRVVTGLSALPLVAEFRNREWQNAQTHEMLAAAGVGWCNVDMPQYDTLLHPSSDVTAAAGYVRFHGRNAKEWWSGDNTSRYAYDYTPDELEAWTERVAEIDERSQTTYAFFNNHARGGAARNAQTFTEMLRERYGLLAENVASASHPPLSQPGLFE